MSDALALEALSRCKIRLRQRNPFFAVLTLFAEYRFDPATQLADTDGRIVRLNASVFLTLAEDVRSGLLLHVTLHAALLHPARQSGRNPELWNVACDIMVNHILTTQTDFPVPPGTLVAKDLSPDFEPVSAERVYEYLLQKRLTANQLAAKLDSKEQEPNANSSDPNMQPSQQKTPGADANQIRKNSLATAMANRFGKTAQPGQGVPQEAPAPATNSGAPLRDIRTPDRQAEAETMRHHWESALIKAREQEAQRQQGEGPSTWLKELEAACAPQIDWRSLLSRFIIHTPTDFSGLDQRFIHAGLYLETLVQERVHVDVAIDTSASIDAAELNQFASELTGILNVYPNILCHLYFCDLQLYGPYPMSPQIELPAARGGGGTDFRPFFTYLDKISGERQVDAAIYFTDGEGDFPDEAPAYPVLWVVIPGAKKSEEFPFGQVIRMV